MISPAIQSRKGSALVISMFVTVIIIMIAIYLLDKIVPTARDVKGIENGNRAYYQAESAINEALLALSSLPAWSETWATYTGSSTTGIGYRFSLSASGTMLPAPSKGTSEYDPNWNRIWAGEPLQLTLPKSAINWSNVKLRIRVPKLGGGGETLSGGITTPAINWILSSESGSLIASGSQIFASEVWKWGDTTGTDINLSGRNGLTPEGTGMTLQNFFNAGWVNCPANQCTLKLSISTPLILSTPTNVLAPYLEYQLDMGAGNPSIPFQYATITTRGYSAGFRKDITRSIRQKTSNEAADFTVFQ